MILKVLILGGTTEARLLADRLAADGRFELLLSFAGRTADLQLPATPYRVGGFGGAPGLAGFLERERFSALVDATHPFAARISKNAVEAAQSLDLPLIRLERPEWKPQPGDRFIEVSDMDAAARTLTPDPQRVFLSIGRQEVGAFRAAPQHDYLIRAVNAFDPGLPRARVILARGPFQLESELELLEKEAIEVVVSKNSGTNATYAKILAARKLGLPVIMVGRPKLPEAEVAHTLEELVSWLDALHGASVRRGV
jgi:precorrin-6A/cobalt-precorrin-6A reductase